MREQEQNRLYMREYREKKRDEISIWRRKWMKKKRIEYRPKIREYYLSNREKANAWWAVFYAVKTGKLDRPDTCQICGNKDNMIQAHHDDYKKKLNVIWICKTCHMRFHLGKEKVNKVIQVRH